MSSSQFCLFAGDRFQRLHEKKSARANAAARKRQREREKRIPLESKLILVLLANIAFGTKKEDLF